MIYGVFSDVHANYEALKEVLKYFEKRKVDGYIFCGDLLGYGPQPEECVEAVRKLKNLHIVIGNHDAAILGKIDIKWFNEIAIKGIEYSKSKIDGKTLAWLSSLPERIDTEKFSIVHASPRNYLKEYILSEAQFRDNLKLVPNQLCFIGHTHMAMYFKLNDDNKVEADFMKLGQKILIKNSTFINPGSVGQPRDSIPLAACGIYDDEKNFFESIRIKYDIEKTQELMKKNGMPDILIERLAVGY